VFELAKATGAAINAGASVWWSTADKNIKAASAAGLWPVGTAVRAAGNQRHHLPGAALRHSDRGGRCVIITTEETGGRIDKLPSFCIFVGHGGMPLRGCAERLPANVAPNRREGRYGRQCRRYTRTTPGTGVVRSMPQTPGENFIKLATPAEGISPMSRSRRDTTFRKADVMRAIRAAQAVGISDFRIEIDKNGVIAIIPGEAPRDNGAANPLDEWMSSRADQTEGH
jgi:hypothetical protein